MPGLLRLRGPSGWRLCVNMGVDAGRGRERWATDQLPPDCEWPFAQERPCPIRARPFFLWLHVVGRLLFGGIASEAVGFEGLRRGEPEADVGAVDRHGESLQHGRGLDRVGHLGRHHDDGYDDSGAECPRRPRHSPCSTEGCPPPDDPSMGRAERIRSPHRGARRHASGGSLNSPPLDHGLITSHSRGCMSSKMCRASTADAWRFSHDMFTRIASSANRQRVNTGTMPMFSPRPALAVEDLHVPVDCGLAEHVQDRSLHQSEHGIVEGRSSPPSAMTAAILSAPGSGDRLAYVSQSCGHPRLEHQASQRLREESHSTRRRAHLNELWPSQSARSRTLPGMGVDHGFGLQPHIGKADQPGVGRVAGSSSRPGGSASRRWLRLLHGAALLGCVPMPEGDRCGGW
jgi:hypothetical protein